MNCFKCKYFFISWDRDQPNGCKAYGFKSPQSPSLVVKKSSGSDCKLFAAKPDKRKSSDDLDLNRDDLW